MTNSPIQFLNVGLTYASTYILTDTVFKKVLRKRSTRGRLGKILISLGSTTVLVLSRNEDARFFLVQQVLSWKDKLRSLFLEAPAPVESNPVPKNMGKVVLLGSVGISAGYLIATKCGFTLYGSGQMVELLELESEMETKTISFNWTRLFILSAGD